MIEILKAGLTELKNGIINIDNELALATDPQVVLNLIRAMENTLSGMKKTIYHPSLEQEDRCYSRSCVLKRGHTGSHSWE